MIRGLSTCLARTKVGLPLAFALVFTSENVARAQATFAPFTYEVARAKRTNGEYGQHVYREERIRLRTGTSGSTVEIYCAISQTRKYDGKVEERPFYWVVRVTPQADFLSDYERGTWGDVAPGNATPEAAAEFKKLCLDEGQITDSTLLRSDTHKSSGSTYDPTTDRTGIVTTSWLVGSWVNEDSCATSAGYVFRADGMYDGDDGSGQWSLAGDKVRILLTSEKTGDSHEDASELPLVKPKVFFWKVSRLGIDRMKLGQAELLRC